MKKIAVAALAATMTVSLAAAPAADAASNTIKGGGMQQTCTIKLDGQAPVTVYRNKVKNGNQFSEFTDENVGLLRTSSDLGEAFGSSDPDTIAAANNAEAIQACKDGKNYQSEEMTPLKQAGIIIGVIVAVGSFLAPVVMPAIQQFLP